LPPLLMLRRTIFLVLFRCAAGSHEIQHKGAYLGAQMVQ
jgi:hypothetical protein